MMMTMMKTTMIIAYVERRSAGLVCRCVMQRRSGLNVNIVG